MWYKIRIILKSEWKPILVLTIGLLLTSFIALLTQKEANKQSYNQFVLECNEVKTKIIARLHAHAELLRSGAAYFSVADTVTRESWKLYIEKSKVERNLPGIQGIGFSLVVPKNELQSHIKIIREEGFAKYTIRPDSDREIYTSIIFLEPFKDRNLRAFGYDMFSEPIRRKAMEIARDFDVASLSGKVILVQETNKDVQAGTLMYVPVYKKNKPTSNIEERRKALLGWVYSPYRMNDLMNGILGRLDSLNNSRIRLKIFDNIALSKEALLFDSQIKESLSGKKKHHTLVTNIVFNGKLWTLCFTQFIFFEYHAANKVIIVIFSGLLISLLLFFLVHSLLNTRKHAQQIAEELTHDLKISESRFKNLFEHHHAIMLLVIPETGLIINANVAAEKFYGYSKAELCSMNINQINALTSEQTALEQSKILNSNLDQFVFPHILASGEIRIVEVHSTPIEMNRQNVLFSIIHDITERNQAEKALQRWAHIFEHANWGITVGSADGNAIEAMNPAFATMHGYTVEELIKKPIPELFAPEHRNDMPVNIIKANQKGHHVWESVHIRKDGTTFPVLIDVTVVKDAGENILYRVINLMDITERKQTEIALQNSEKLFRDSLEFLPIPIGIANKKGEIIDYNKAFTDTYGYDIKDIPTIETWLIKAYPDKTYREYVAKIWDEDITQATENKQTTTLREYKVTDKFGIEHDVEIIMRPVGDIFVASFNDITKNKKILSELRASEERWKFAVEGARDGLWDWNLETNEVFFSTQWKAMLGFEEHEIKGSLEEWSKRVHPDDLQKCYDDIQLHLDNKVPYYSNTHRVLCKNGQYKWILDRGKIISYNADGKPIRMIGTHTDLTERIKIEQALKESQAKSLAILHTLPDMMFIQNKEGEYIDYYIPKSVQTFVPPKVFMGQRIENVLPPGIVDEFLPLFNKAIETGLVQFYEYSLPMPDRQRFYESRTIAFDADKVLSIVRDITDRKNAELEVGQIRKNYETFFNTIDDFLFVLDHQGNIIHVNETVNNRLEYTDEELYGQSVLMVHPVDRRAEAGRIVGEMLEGKAEFCPVPIITKSGLQIPVETRISKGFWNGNPAIFGVTKDVSQIRLSEEKFSKLFYINPSACGLSDLKTGKYIEVNNVFHSLLGFEIDEVIGKTAIELGILSAKTIKEILKKSNKNGSVYNVEADLRAKNGDIKRVLLSSENFYIQDNQYRFTVVHDITARIQAEEALLQSNKKLEAIISASPDGVGMASLDGKLKLVSDRLAEIYGFSKENKEELLGKSVFEFIDESNHELLKENIQKLIRKSKNHKITEYLAIKKDKSRFYIDVNSALLYDSEGNPESILFVERDITDRKFALDAIKKNELHMVLAFNMAHLGHWEYDVEKDLFTFNEIFYRIFKNSVENIGSYSLTSKQYAERFVYSEDYSIVGNEIANALATDDPYYSKYVEHRFLYSNGDIGYLAVRVQIQKDDQGKTNRLYGVNQDITEQKKIEEALIKSKQDAEIANKAKSEFLANMSHEIRTPMNAILGFSEALYHKLDSDQHKKMVKSILNGGNLLLSLLNDILDLSKIEAGKLEISPQPVDLSNLLQEILSLFSEKANTKGIEIRYFTSSDFPNAIMLDEIRVKQIMFNLIGNAIKFTPKGHVFIKLSYKPSTNHSGQLIIEVEDTGIGIPESQFEMIFEAFRQQSGQSNREFVGTGLGLAISKRLIEKMDGTIAVKSEVGKGSTFQLVFPEIETSPVLTPIKDEYASVSDIIFEQAIILVIDDVLSNIEAVENLLASTPLSIHSALSGEIGIEILKHMHPDLILLDMRLPGIDGYEVSRMIKKEPTLKDIPLIAYTASVSSISKIESSSDFDDFLYKPIKRNDLFAILKKFLKYKIDESINQHTMTSNTENLIIRAELPEELPKVLEILNDRFVPEWSKIKDTLILFKIAHFADDLKKMAIEYKFNYLINYAGKMKEYVDMIEIESIRAQLYKFPDIIEKLKQLSNT